MRGAGINFTFNPIVPMFICHFTHNESQSKGFESAEIRAEDSQTKMSIASRIYFDLFASGFSFIQKEALLL